MKSIYILFFLLFGSITYAQDTTEVEVFRNTLSLGEALQFDGRSIKFKELISDSRCPRTVTCIWAGEARILVEVFENGKICGTEVLTVAAGDKLPNFLQKYFPDKSISLTSLLLAPYPEVPGEINQKEYTLSVEVAMQAR